MSFFFYLCYNCYSDRMMRKIIFVIIIFLVNLNFVYAKETVKYLDCVDGDTIKVLVNNEEKTVRLLAIDTPESVKPNSEIEYYGKEASEYTCNKIKKAKKIVLEYDPNSDKVDKYDRLLAWVFVDDKLLQTELVEKGYAKVAYLYGDYKYIDTLMAKQEKASAKNIGIWDENAKAIYEANLVSDNKIIRDDYTNKEIVIIVILFLIIVFISDKNINKKAKKKLNKYL